MSKQDTKDTSNVQIGPRVDKVIYKNFKVLCAIKGISIRQRIEHLLRKDVVDSKVKK